MKLEDTSYKPVKVVEIDLFGVLPSFSMVNNNNRYDKAFIFVRLFSVPIGTFELDVNGDLLEPDDYIAIIWERFKTKINRTLVENGLSAVEELTSAGIASDKKPHAISRRERFYEKAPPVSIAIPTRGRPDTLEGTIRSVLDIEYPNYEIVIIDNDAKPSETYRLINSVFANEPLVRYVFSPNAGTAGARNIGAQEAKYDIVAYTDDDVIVDKYWLLDLIQGFEAADNIACVTGLTLPYQLETQTQEWFQKNSGFDRGYEQVIIDMKEYKPNKLFFPYTVGIMGTGANMAIKKQIIENLGGFDTLFGGGTPLFAGEENDLYYRILTSGYQMIYHPYAIAWHIHRRDYEAYRQRTYRYGVSLTAYIMKAPINEPQKILPFLLKIPIAIYLLLAPNSVHNKDKPDNFPSELRWLELAGMLRGPIEYVRQLVRYRGQQRPVEKVDVNEVI